VHLVGFIRRIYHDARSPEHQTIHISTFLLVGVHPQKLALTSPTGGGCSVGIVRVRTKATELVS